MTNKRPSVGEEDLSGTQAPGATQVATAPQSHRTLAEGPCRNAGRRDHAAAAALSPQAPVGATEVATNHGRLFCNQSMRQLM